MSINTKRELLQRVRREYSVASRDRKGVLLNCLIEATGYNRKYAISILNQPASTKPPRRRQRARKYGSEVVDTVRQLWRAANGICAKRLLPFLSTLIQTLERFGHMKLSKQLKETILEMSVSTLERILRKERAKQAKGMSLTRPGSLLRKQIAVKTFAQWSDQEIGFFEVDLVAHCGGDISGRFLHTLTMTDIATGWTEVVPLLHKADTLVRSGMEEVIKLIPFELRGIDSDNGSEFLNFEMVAWCKARKITFTRSRAYRKDDQAHVEEKNGSVVRRLVGYERFEGLQALEVMKELYLVARLYINFFQPSMKLVKKTRVGSKVIKQYDTARTPLERLLLSKSNSISKSQRTVLLAEFRKLDPVMLLAKMAKLQSKLWQIKENKDEQAASAKLSMDSKSPRPERATQWTTRTDRGKISKRIVELSHGTPVKADDFLTKNARRRRRHLVNVVLRDLCEDGLLNRLSFGNYVRANENRKSETIADKPAKNTTKEIAIPERAVRRARKNEARKVAEKTRIEFTEDFVRNASIPKNRYYVIYRDSILIGFGLRVTSGSKTFIVEARVNGQSRRLSIGRADLFSLEEAREEAVRLLRQMTSGICPLTLKKKNK